MSGSSAGYRGPPDYHQNGMVVGLQGRDVSLEAPTDQYVLTWDATTSKGLPKAAPSASSGLSGMTAEQVPVAATATTVTSSRATGTTGNSTILQTDSGGKIVATVIPDTAVTPDSYTLASITVSADGRLTAASNGSLGTVASITLSEIAAPTAPVSGAILYVDSTSHLLSYVDSQGNRAVIT